MLLTVRGPRVVSAAGQYLTFDSTHGPETGIQTYIVGLQHLALPQQAAKSSGWPNSKLALQSLNSLPWATLTCPELSPVQGVLLTIVKSIAQLGAADVSAVVLLTHAPPLQKPKPGKSCPLGKTFLQLTLQPPATCCLIWQSATGQAY